MRQLPRDAVFSTFVLLLLNVLYPFHVTIVHSLSPRATKQQRRRRRHNKTAAAATTTTKTAVIDILHRGIMIDRKPYGNKKIRISRLCARVEAEVTKSRSEWHNVN